MTILILGNSDSNSFWLEPKPGVDFPDWSKYFKREINDSFLGRQSILEIWDTIILIPNSKSGKFSIKNFKDVHGFGMLKGFENIVSDRFKRLFEAEFPGVCTFLPLTVEQAPFPYWGLWANYVINAIDESSSQILPTATGFKNVGKRKYRDEIINADVPVFRLPMDYAFESDQITELFCNFISVNKLTNFKFYDKNI